MPRPAIIMPDTVSISRDGKVYVWKTPAGERYTGENPIGSVRPGENGGSPPPRPPASAPSDLPERT